MTVGPDPVAPLRERLTGGGGVWLDLVSPSGADLARLRRSLGLHALAIEDLEHFGQRPKIDDYESHALVVLYGAADDEDHLVEVHCLVGPSWLVTVRREACAAIEHLQRRVDDDASGARLLHRVADALVDSFPPLLDQTDDRIALLESFVGQSRVHPTEHPIMRLRRQLIGLRRVLEPQRELLSRLAGGTAPVPGLDDDLRRYFRDVQDHALRVADRVEGQRELLSGLLGLELAVMGDRNSRVNEKLTLIATIALPLVAISGFFGQNFGWMVSRIGSLWAFLGLGVGVPFLVTGVLLWLLHRREWL